MPAHPRPQQDEFTVAGNHEIDHLGVAVADLEPVAHEQAQIARQRRLGIVDRLVLAHHAAQFVRNRAGARFQRRVRENLIHLDGMQRRSTHKRQHDQNNPNAPDHLKSLSAASAGRAATTAALRKNYSAGCAKILAAGFGAPIRNLRSDNDSAPPIAITIAPSQIISTSGL